MEKVLLLRFGELFLKGKNQGYFEQFLQRNVFAQIGLSSKRLRGRFLLPYFPEHSSLSRVFGFTSYSPAICVKKEVEMITATALQLMYGLSGTFKIETNRADKRFPLTSVQLNMLIGKKLEEEKKLAYVRNNPQHTLQIEINQDGAYLFTETFPCSGGLPVGVEGKVLLLLENENPNHRKRGCIITNSGDFQSCGYPSKDTTKAYPSVASNGVSATNDASILAGILIMKRGCAIVPVSFKEKTDISLLQKYSPFPLTVREVDSQEEFLDIAQRENALALVTGESFDLLEKKNFLLPVFKPLVGYSEEEVKEGLRRYC